MESPQQKYRNVLSYTMRDLIPFLKHLDSVHISKKDEIETQKEIYELQARRQLVETGWRKFGSITNNWRNEQ